MAVKPLNERQLFRMKRENLEKRINQYYAETHDSEAVLEYGMAVLVRNAIVMEDYSFICKDLIRKIFLTSEPSKKMQDYCLYFYDYFDYSDWEIVRKRLFKHKAEFSELTRPIRALTKLVRAAAAPTFDTVDDILTMITKNDTEERKANAFANKDRYTFLYKSFFEDANGKKHNLTFRHADISKSDEEFYSLLEILTKLTIFEKDGTRRFTEIVWDDCQKVTKFLIYSSKLDDKEKSALAE
ncbi:MULTISPECIES: hypothetical protein [Enterococcus]|uniref:hypothetical protein n=1 Tax=Enterococcus TaxID=1350 RepID=UPI000EE9EE7D|nr:MULTISPECIES: hypothetical protein [Enterococcus]HCM85925.1 hypothetical protein [Enterococcus sp.]